MPVAHVAEDLGWVFFIHLKKSSIAWSMCYHKKLIALKCSFRFSESRRIQFYSVPLKMDIQILFMKDVFSYITCKF